MEYINTIASTEQKESVFGVILICIFPAFSIQTEHGEIRISRHSVRMWDNAGKNADQNNSKYGHFLCSG